MECPKCKTEMEHEDGIHRFNERTHYCGECGYEKTEDITGDLIDYAKNEMEGK